MSKRLIRIEIPAMVPRALGPNASRRLHWGQITKIKHTWQQTVWYCAIQYRDAGFKKASLSVTCVVKDNRSIMDTDNILSALKSATDLLTARTCGANRKTGNPGVQGLGIILDDSPDVLEIKPVNWIIDKAKTPMVILEIREL